MASGMLQIKLLTHEKRYAVPDSELSVPASIDPDGLTKLIVGLLKENDDENVTREKLRFSFVCLRDFIPEGSSLETFFGGREDVVSTSESVFEIRYFPADSPPNPFKSENHDDWVSSVSALPDDDRYVLSASYDGKVVIWDLSEKEPKLLTIPAHVGPAKCVRWVEFKGHTGVFATSGQDQLVNLYRWDAKENAVTEVNACKGHERSADCLAVEGDLLASGSFDNNVKLWSSSLEKSGDEVDDESKKMKMNDDGPKKAATRSPLVTLSGHKEAVSSLTFTDSKSELVSASWDHTVRIWDLEVSGMKSEIVGHKSFFDISWSSLSKTLLTASADRFIRAYDPRCAEGASSVVRSTYTSHKGWVTALSWCADSEYRFVSGSHDALVKMWDTRSCKTPMYDLNGHSDRVMCCDWSNVGYVVSGGADNDMKVFNVNKK